MVVSIMPPLQPAEQEKTFMTKTLRTMTTTLGLAVIAAAIAPIAALGCDGMPGTPPAASPGSQAPYLIQAAYRPAQFVRVSDSGASDPSIVGLWSVKFVAQNSPGTPDGTVVDWGYVQWHSDGTEMENSGARSPSTENFCMGVWAQTGPSTYKLNHVALSYDATSGALNGYVSIHEQVKLEQGGNKYAGTFTINIVDPNGNPVANVVGKITATRITADQ
jgi:hypothetical protein